MRKSTQLLRDLVYLLTQGSRLPTTIVMISLGRYLIKFDLVNVMSSYPLYKVRREWIVEVSGLSVRMMLGHSFGELWGTRCSFVSFDTANIDFSTKVRVLS